jgi:hypothetical protein
MSCSTTITVFPVDEALEVPGEIDRPGAAEVGSSRR